MLTLGSLFDGIGGWLLAAQHAGIEPIWASEIAPFPASVTAHHFPNVVQLGDITGIQDLPPVDIVTCGSPCQDLSVAGKRKGLSGERSGLFIRAVELVRRLRMSTGGRYPRFFVWENVPGAFSSNKGADFRAVLEEIGQTSIPMPEGGKWANAGLAELPECEIAWRVLDAQHHIPQRRKRIFLVADFAAERRCAGEILLISESVSRDSSEGRAAREGTAAGAESGIGNASGDCLTPWDCQAKRIYKQDGVFPCLQSTESNGEKPGSVYVPVKARSLTARNDGSPCVDRGPEIIAAGFKAGAGADAGGIGYQVEQMPTLMSAESGTQRPTVAVYGVGIKKNGKAGTLDASYYKGTGARSGKERTCVAVFDMTHANNPVQSYTHDVCHTLTARMGTGGNQVPVVSYAIAGNTIDRQDENGGNGKGVLAETSYTLNTVDRHAVATQKSVRSLTPTEAERLQGLPDGYTLIDDKSCSDSARYKALGNGMAQPCADYVIRRIVEVMA